MNNQGQNLIPHEERYLALSDMRGNMMVCTTGGMVLEIYTDAGIVRPPEGTTIEEVQSGKLKY